ncbi:sulfite exporter TauE/SafE family protein [Roseibium algae]|uniref:Probable membrane transporter protein n=1 Tax=Roseibium algae TaxID=3123038 RepID=A0ABU8TP96_9HYPH
MSEIDISIVVYALLACALGGLLKGATGAGAPVIGVPVLAAMFDVQFAVAVFVTPNLLTNVWQGWQFRKSLLSWQFVVLFAGGGAIGAIIGTYLLAGLPSDLLLICMSLVVLGYVGFRLLNADWILPYGLAVKLAGPAGILGGILQGATGISAPASLTFLNALKLPRGAFIATISVFFGIMSAMQFERMVAVGLLTFDRFLLGLGATVAILAVMPVGAWMATKIARATFDRIILALLVVIAVKILIEVALF